MLGPEMAILGLLFQATGERSTWKSLIWPPKGLSSAVRPITPVLRRQWLIVGEWILPPVAIYAAEEDPGPRKSETQPLKEFPSALRDDFDVTVNNFEGRLVIGGVRL